MYFLKVNKRENEKTNKSDLCSETILDIFIN